MFNRTSARQLGEGFGRFRLSQEPEDADEFEVGTSQSEVEKNLRAENESLRKQNQHFRFEVHRLKSILFEQITEKSEIFKAKEKLEVQVETLQGQVQILQEENRSLRDENASLRMSLVVLEKQVGEQKEKMDKQEKIIRDHQQKIDQQERTIRDHSQKMDEQDAMIAAYDLAVLYNFYKVQPVLQQVAPKTPLWRDFANDLADTKAQREDGEITEEDFEAWLHPVQSKIPLDLVKFQEMIKERNGQCHEDTRSVANQKIFLAKMEKGLPFPSQYQPLIDQMLADLKQVHLKRRK